MLGSVPAAMVCGCARWVRSGPTLPPAIVPRIAVAHHAGAREEDVAARAVVGVAGGSGAGCAAAAQPGLERRRGLGDDAEAPCARAAGRRTRRTGRGRRPAGRPGARCVRRGPGSGRACRAGSAPRSCGSRRARCSSMHDRDADRDVDLVRGRDGMRSGSRSWYWTSHHHWWPITLIVERGCADERRRARPVGDDAGDDQHDEDQRR